MNTEEPPIWECDHDIIVQARAEVIWRCFLDIASWPQWNAGVAEIHMEGEFEAGNHFMMVTPERERFTTRLVEVRELSGFLDETRVGELRVFVDHQIRSISEDVSQVVFSLQAFGPGCDELGPAISADFPAVLRALAARAESATCEAA